MGVLAFKKDSFITETYLNRNRRIMSSRLGGVTWSVFLELEHKDSEILGWYHTNELYR